MGLKIHFFTIVRNGMPFIRHHIEVFSQLSAEWHWHLVEGLADLKNDTAWSVTNGATLPDDFQFNVLSNDGTSDYLDELRIQHPDQITIYRKPEGQLWDGKLEMVQAPIVNIHKECLLWQVDVDEFWNARQIESIHAEFTKDLSLTAAWYWCNFHVTNDSIISTRNCYGQNPRQEWLRTWHFKPGDRWMAHEPPTLVRKSWNGSVVNVGKIKPLNQNKTERLGAVFDHLAYVNDAQLRFKELYYGYKGGLERWHQLQEQLQIESPLLLSRFFPWVRDSTYVAKITSSDLVIPDLVAKSKSPMVLIDGIAFQFPWTRAICRVWTAILKEWVKSGFSKYVTVLDRGGTFPRIPGINTVPFELWSESRRGEDSFRLEQECGRRMSEIFISTYHTLPISTPSVALIHDFIPERLGSSMKENLWHEKKLSIRHASAHVCVSQNTAKDLTLIHPEVNSEQVFASNLGTDPEMRPSGESEAFEFQRHYGISKPYILFVGERIGLVGEPEHVAGYKNAKLLFLAMHQWEHASNYDVVLIGGAAELEDELSVLAPEISPILVRASDPELAAAYSGAVALIYPSRYEGFGLPILEAMKCGCPVITTIRSSLPEVGGDVPIYVDPDDIEGIRGAILKVLDQTFRETMISKGLKRAEKFQWKSLAESVQSSLCLASDSKPAKVSLFKLLRFIQWRSERLEAHIQKTSSAGHSMQSRFKRWEWLIILKIADFIENVIIHRRNKKPC